jgi:hypothetical protein
MQGANNIANRILKDKKKRPLLEALPSMGILARKSWELMPALARISNPFRKNRVWQKTVGKKKGLSYYQTALYDFILRKKRRQGHRLASAV